MRSARLLAVTVLAVVLTLSAAMPASAHINLLQNPGFETGDFPPWEIDGDGEWDGGLGGPGHTGTSYAWIDADDGEAWIWQDIDPPRCAEYLEFYYLGTEGEGGISVGVYYSDNTDHWEELPTTRSWSLIHVNLDTTKLVEAVEAYNGGVGGALAVDDFDLEACPAAAVGGVVMPAGMFAILAPWLAVIGVVGCIGTVVVVAKKRGS